MRNVQRLNGSGSFILLFKIEGLRYSLSPGEYPINRAKAWVQTVAPHLE